MERLNAQRDFILLMGALIIIDALLAVTVFR
jgi:hypothetical protein